METEEEGQHETASYEGLKGEIASSRFKFTGDGDATVGNLPTSLTHGTRSDHFRDIEFVYNVLQCIHCNICRQVVGPGSLG